MFFGKFHNEITSYSHLIYTLFTPYSHHTHTFWFKIMSKFQSDLTLRENILELLKEGQKHVSEIKEAFPEKASSVSNCMTGLRREGKVVLVDRGIYRLPTAQERAAVKNLRGETENTETINKMLNLYDRVLDNIAATFEKELAEKAMIEEKINLIKSLRWLGATVDQLMNCLLYTSPSPRDRQKSRMPSSA